MGSHSYPIQIKCFFFNIEIESETLLLSLKYFIFDIQLKNWPLNGPEKTEI